MQTQIRRRRSRKPPDRGTPEQQLRRARLAGEGGDTNRVAVPLDVYLQRKIITPGQPEAGLIYSVLYGIFCGRTTAKSSLLDELDRSWSVRPNDEQENIETAYREAAAAIQPHCKPAVDDVCCYHHFIGIDRFRESLMGATAFTGLTGQTGECASLCAGLADLANHFRVSI